MTPAHVMHRHTITIDQPLARALELFTPQGERWWAKDWDPAWHWPPDGATRVGMVFTTDHGGEHTIWTMTRHEPANGFVEYVRTTPGSRVGIVRVQCSAVSERATRVEVGYEITALTDAGREMLATLDEAAFAAFIESWREAIGRL
jgi:hypothetical protein